MAQLPLTNVINISVSAAQTGIGEYNINNLALFTNEPYAMSFGNAGYSIYLAPTQVGVDFGTASETFAMANQVFSQQPNILAGGGYLVVIPMMPAIQMLSFDRVASSGSFNLVYGGSSSSFLPFNASATTIQTALQALPGLLQVSVAGTVASETVDVTFYGFVSAPTNLTVGANTLLNGGSAVGITASTTQSQETLAAAITRTQGLVQYFGVMENATMGNIGSPGVVAAANAIQALNKLLFMVSDSPSDLGTAAIITSLTQSSLSQTRSLYYNGGTDLLALEMMASYAGRALSTNFEGSNTTETMHLKQLIGVQPDPSITQTLLNQAVAAGADTYVSLQGVPAVFTSGANQYFDQVYNLQWLVGALQVAGFNYLATSSTKIPQTEQGMTGLKGAYRAVLQQAVTNDYVAPGTWNSSTTFGNQVDFLNNILTFGYYIYSQPVSQQSQASRVARQAPLVQIALKESGAVQSSNVVVFVNP